MFIRQQQIPISKSQSVLRYQPLVPPTQIIGYRPAPQPPTERNPKTQQKKIKCAGLPIHQPFKTTNNSEQGKTNQYHFQLKQFQSPSVKKPPLKQVNQSSIQSQALQSPKKKAVSIQHKGLEQYVTQLKHLGANAHSERISQDSHSTGLILEPQSEYYISELKLALLHEDRSFSQSYCEHISVSFNYLQLVKELKLPSKEDIQSRKLSIPQKKKYKYNKTIIFDLDETLVHCNEDESDKSQVYLEITFPTGQSVNAGINIRPFAMEIIQKLSEVCEVMVFTASHECYANKVIDYIDKDNNLSHRLFRDSCVQVENFYIKNLDVIDRDQKNVVIVDNASYSFAHQIDNGIPIISYYDFDKDNQLIQLYRFLLNRILPADDVRPVIREHFKLSRLNEFETPQEAVQHLYI